MALISDESMPFIAYSRIVRRDKVALKLEDLAVCTWLQSLVVE